MKDFLNVQIKSGIPDDCIVNWRKRKGPSNNFFPRKKQRTLGICPLEVMEVICICFSYLDIADHFKLAKVSKFFLGASGLCPNQQQPGAWSKYVRLPPYFTDAQLHRFCELGGVTSLSLENCNRITTKGLTSLNQLPLISLNLSWCNIPGDALAHLSELKKLQELYLKGCINIKDKHLGHLQTLNLTTLDLTFCEDVTDAGLSFLQKLPLRELYLNNCHRITDAGLFLLQKLPLRELYLNNCRRITDDGLAHLNMLLEILDLTLCEGITDNGLLQLRGGSLRELILAECSSHITTTGLAYLQNHPLERLDLSWCQGITDGGLSGLGEFSLQSLNLAGCANITGVGLVNLNSSLNKLDISNSGVTVANAQTFQQQNPGCTIKI